jgi:hypothetical protein
MTIKRNYYQRNNTVKSERNYPMYYANIIFCQLAKNLPHLAN